MTITHKCPEELFCRDDEVKQICELIDKANNGIPCLAFISGPPGTGKTVIMKKIMKSLNVEKNISIYCKFDEYNLQKPYYPFVQLIRELIKYVIAMPREKAKVCMQKIKKAIGNNIDAISDFIPELRYVYDKKINTENLNQRSQKVRIQFAFYQIVKDFAEQDKPIILFIDDLQWADELSLEILEYFCCNFENERILIMCAYRECPKMHSFLKKIESIRNENLSLERITLSNFTIQQMYDLVYHSLTISGNENDIDEIAMDLYKKTMGNPLFISQINRKFENEEKQPIPDDIVLLIADKIVSLPEKTKKALTYASIIGNTFSLELLSNILCSNSDDVLLLLDSAFIAGLIIPSGSYNEFEFVHDKIREAIIQMTDEYEYLHLIIGRELLNSYKSGSDNFSLIEILFHFIVSVELVDSEHEKIELAEYFITAGDALIKTAAYIEAVQYFEIAKKFIENESSVQYPLKFNLYLGYAQALFLNEYYPQAEETFEIAFSYAKSNADYAKILWIKTILYFSIGDNEMTTATGLEALSKVGIYLPINPLRIRTVLEMGKLIWISHKNHVIKYHKSNKKDAANKTELLIDIMATLSMSAIICHPELFKVLMSLIGQISIKSGNPEYIPLGYTEYGIMAGSIFYNFERERKLRDLSIDFARKYEDNNHYINFINPLFVNYWLDDWHKNIVCFDMVYKSAIEEGKFISAASILLQKIVFLFCTGTNINDLIIESQNVYSQVEKLQAKFYTECILCIKKAFEAIRILSVEVLDDDMLIQWFGKNHMFICYLAKIQIYFLEGNYQQAIKLVMDQNEHDEVLTAFCQYADFVFYQSLTITVSGNGKKIRYNNTLYRNMYKLRKWFESCPSNFGHKYYLVSAEMARVKGRPGEAADLYEKAILSASENGFTQNEAIASELAGKFFYSVGNWQTAEKYMLNAHAKYNQWGAEKKAFLLEQEYPYLTKKEDFNNIEVLEEKRERYSDKIAEALKIVVHENDTFKLFNRMLDIILDIGSAERACLLTEKNDELYILCTKDDHHSTSEFTDIPLAEYGNLPQMLIYYSFNTYEPIILNRNQEKGVFINDLYINERSMSSHFCIPLILDNILIGVLYLEKYSNAEECSAECIEAIKVLSCQAMLLSKLERLINVKDKEKVKSTCIIVEELTPKEKETLGLIATGSSNKEIAEALGVSVNTVKTHVLSIYGKLNVSRRSQAAVKAKDFNLVG